MIENEEKQIEEMAQDIYDALPDYEHNYLDCRCAAEELFSKGYCKQSEPISCGHEKGGEWKLGKSGCMYFCSECNYAAHPREVDEWSYCPRCGAKMRGV